jgi:tRNA(fMet)-specific endonuclease VapC
MDGSRLLDANLVIAYLENERAVVERALAADEVFVSVIVLGELHFGARKSTRPDENLDRIASFLEWAKVVDCDEETAELYGVIKQQLRAKGKMIPDNDIWIAATSRQIDVTLASRDQHFEHVDYLSWEVW